MVDSSVIRVEVSSDRSGLVMGTRESEGLALGSHFLLEAVYGCR